MNEIICAPVCPKCENEPKYVLRRRDGGMIYFYNLGPNCEAERQKARRNAEVVLKTVKWDRPTLVFRNDVQVALWTNEICGQLSDGYWENTNPHDHWKAWCDAIVVRAEEGEATGRNFAVRKEGYRLTGLIEYVGDRMMADAEKATGEKVDAKRLRKELIDMAKIMKTRLK